MSPEPDPIPADEPPDPVTLEVQDVVITTEADTEP